MTDEMSRTSQIEAFEQEAELLSAMQLDLLTQIEAQLRAVHHTLHRIQRLRKPSARIGPELSNGERKGVLSGLTQEVAAVEAHLFLQLTISRDMQSTIATMQERLIAVKQLAETHRESDDRRDSI
jgi:hypothetical protein